MVAPGRGRVPHAVARALARPKSTAAAARGRSEYVRDMFALLQRAVDSPVAEAELSTEVSKPRHWSQQLRRRIDGRGSEPGPSADASLMELDSFALHRSMRHTPHATAWRDAAILAADEAETIALAAAFGRLDYSRGRGQAGADESRCVPSAIGDSTVAGARPWLDDRRGWEPGGHADVAARSRHMWEPASAPAAVFDRHAAASARAWHAEAEAAEAAEEAATTGGRALPPEASVSSGHESAAGQLGPWRGEESAAGQLVPWRRPEHSETAEGRDAAHDVLGRRVSPFFPKMSDLAASMPHHGAWAFQSWEDAKGAAEAAHFLSEAERRQVRQEINELCAADRAVEEYKVKPPRHPSRNRPSPAALPPCVTGT